jgi:hypothetical protein
MGYARGVNGAMSRENCSVSNIQVLHVTHPFMGGVMEILARTRFSVSYLSASPSLGNA